MSTLPITDAFGAYLTDERHFSPYTARCYGADLRQFVEFLGAQNSISPDAAKESEALRKDADTHAHAVLATFRPLGAFKKIDEVIPQR